MAEPLLRASRPRRYQLEVAALPWLPLDTAGDMAEVVFRKGTVMSKPMISVASELIWRALSRTTPKCG